MKPVVAILNGICRLVWTSIVLAVSSAPTFAHADEAMEILQRIAHSVRRLTYDGTFVYRHGDTLETSRIAHAVVDGRELERIEVLDGSPREIVRDARELKCFLPDEKRVLIEDIALQDGESRRFPALLPLRLSSLLDHYSIRLGAQGRVAGLPSRAVLLEPRDNLRYGHELWVDNASGLLLKAVLRNERGAALESFAFTQLKVGGPLAPDRLKPHFDAQGVQVHHVRTVDVKSEGLGWNFRTMLPGFRRVMAMKRQPMADRPESLHVVFSDSLATISVFIEPGSPTAPVEESVNLGAINLYRRQLDEYRVLVMGEAPFAAVKLLGDGIERKRK